VGKMIVFDRPNGKPCAGYLAEPGANRRGWGFVVIQEWWGLNDQIKETADFIASAGYRALAPDLYVGKLANSSSEAGHMMANLDFLDASDQDILGAVQYLKRDSKKIVVGGFCMGGALTILSAVRLREMDAGVCFYGIPTLDAERLKTIHVPLICHFANSDDWCTPEKVNVLEASLKESRSAFELYRYDAHHGFMNPRRGRVYNAGSSEAAWERTFTFLARVLSPPV
jgi:carboxymethylenebutenolidase